MKPLNEQQLLNFKEKILKKKESLQELRGEQKALMERLKNEFKCSTIEAAEKKIKELKKELDSLDEQIQEKAEQLEKDYDLVE